MKLKVKTDCDHPPEKKLMADLTFWFASYQIDVLTPYFAEDIRWELIGDDPIIGKDNFAEALKKMSGEPVTQLIINHIITHGQEAAVDGEMMIKNGNRYAFADFYEFESAGVTKIKSIISYLIKI